MSTQPSTASQSLQPLLAAQAQMAQAAQAALDAGQQLRERQSAAGLGLLHAQLDLLNGGFAGPSGRQLAQLQFQFIDNLASGQKETLRLGVERTQQYLADLRRTVSGDEVSITTLGYFKDLGKVLHDGAEQAATLINSTSAASTVLTRQTLDEAIEAAKT
ncbi:MAG: hypothetical protein ABW202_11635 [Duganella sp.]